jgi:hypothetical protein
MRSFVTKPSRVPVFKFALRCDLGVVTTATLRLSSPDVLCANDALSAAVTPKQPIRSRVADRCGTLSLTNGHQSAEPLSRNLGRKHHISPLYHDNAYLRHYGWEAKALLTLRDED